MKMLDFHLFGLIWPKKHYVGVSLGSEGNSNTVAYGEMKCTCVVISTFILNKHDKQITFMSLHGCIEKRRNTKRAAQNSNKKTNNEMKRYQCSFQKRTMQHSN